MVQSVQLQWLLDYLDLKSNLVYFIIHNFNVICWKVNEYNGKHKHEKFQMQNDC